MKSAYRSGCCRTANQQHHLFSASTSIIPAAFFPSLVVYICHRIIRNIRYPWRDIRFVALFFFSAFSYYSSATFKLYITLFSSFLACNLSSLSCRGGIQIVLFACYFWLVLYAFYFYLVRQSCSSSAILVILFIVLRRVRKFAV